MAYNCKQLGHSGAGSTSSEPMLVGKDEVVAWISINPPFSKLKHTFRDPIYGLRYMSCEL